VNKTRGKGEQDTQKRGKSLREIREPHGSKRGRLKERKSESEKEGREMERKTQRLKKERERERERQRRKKKMRKR